ncbi:BtaA family protein [Stieleria sp. TO1_6]|nr:BtaA family protein [Stieleria tagensis]
MMGSDWIHVASKLPVAFAQVREDPWIDQEIVRSLAAARPRVLMVASGGETAALISTMPLHSLQLVDINPSQLALTRLKLQLLTDATPIQRQRLLGHLTMDCDDRQQELARRLEVLGESGDVFGPLAWVSEIGPDHCGRYEILFAELRRRLLPVRDQVESLMLMDDPSQQAAFAAPETTLGRALDTAWHDVMQLEILQTIFGRDATANRVTSFAKHFCGQMRRALARSPASTNPFLHQLFLGHFATVRWPWLDAKPQSIEFPIDVTCDSMHDVLASQPDRSYDLIHLSNTLDWVSLETARQVLADVSRCLTPGGIVVIRQLNSMLRIRELVLGVEWDQDWSQHLHDQDRSFFYRELHIGRRRQRGAIE